MFNFIENIIDSIQTSRTYQHIQDMSLNNSTRAIGMNSVSYQPLLYTDDKCESFRAARKTDNKENREWKKQANTEYWMGTKQGVHDSCEKFKSKVSSLKDKIFTKKDAEKSTSEETSKSEQPVSVKAGCAQIPAVDVVALIDKAIGIIFKFIPSLNGCMDAEIEELKTFLANPEISKVIISEIRESMNPAEVKKSIENFIAEIKDEQKNKKADAGDVKLTDDETAKKELIIGAFDDAKDIMCSVYPEAVDSVDEVIKLLKEALNDNNLAKQLISELNEALNELGPDDLEEMANSFKEQIKKDAEDKAKAEAEAPADDDPSKAFVA